MKTLKHIPLLMAMLIAIFFGSCNKSPLNPVKDNSLEQVNKSIPETGYCGNVTVTQLLAGQSTPAGQVIVTNNGSSLRVTYKVSEEWVLQAVHLYVGDIRLMPKTKTGNPIPGQFPYKVVVENSIFEYTFVIPLASVGNCFSVAAHANVINRDSNIEETAWGNGTIINAEGNWGMYFDVCKQVCGEYEL